MVSGIDLLPLGLERVVHPSFVAGDRSVTRRQTFLAAGAVTIRAPMPKTGRAPHAPDRSSIMTNHARRTVAAAGGAVLVAALLGRRGGVAAPGAVFRVRHTDAEWQRLLSPTAFDVLRRQGTEPPWSSPLLHVSGPGRFTCAGCTWPLFDIATKYDSGTGWPSFWAPMTGAVQTRTDRTLMMSRNEVHCANCGGHLGHVFDDGPRPTGLRYCMNGVALTFART
jgi:peptide-methionine (R)-S-oxide reductase